MSANNAIFLEVIEWFDKTGREIVKRIPEKGSGDIKFGAQLTVRESQAGVFFYKGKACDAFGPGRHTLVTANFPVLTKVLSFPWGFTSPLRAEVYFVNLKMFTDLRWGTKDPVAFKDSKLGLVRLRAFGMFNIRVVQPILFINTLVGTQGLYTTGDIEEYLSRVAVSRFNDHMGENLDSLLNLPGRYDQLSRGLEARLQEDFAHYGLSLSHVYIQSITPPREVQQAIDDQSRLAVLPDLDRLVRMKAAMAMEKAAVNPGDGASGMGLGLGLMMPAMFRDLIHKPDHSGGSSSQCPECRKPVPVEARFCLHCGHQLVIFCQCGACGENLSPLAKFCSRCGQAVSDKPKDRICGHCGSENLPLSIYCNQCGEKI